MTRKLKTTAKNVSRVGVGTPCSPLTRLCAQSRKGRTTTRGLPRHEMRRNCFHGGVGGVGRRGELENGPSSVLVSVWRGKIPHPRLIYGELLGSFQMRPSLACAAAATAAAAAAVQSLAFSVNHFAAVPAAGARDRASSSFTSSTSPRGDLGRSRQEPRCVCRCCGCWDRAQVVRVGTSWKKLCYMC